MARIFFFNVQEQQQRTSSTRRRTPRELQLERHTHTYVVSGLTRNIYSLDIHSLWCIQSTSFENDFKLLILWLLLLSLIARVFKSINKVEWHTERKKVEFILRFCLGRETRWRVYVVVATTYMRDTALICIGVVCQRRLVHSSFYYSAFGSFSHSLIRRAKKQNNNFWLDG